MLDFWKSAAGGTGISDDLAGVERLHARDPEALLLARSDGELVGNEWAHQVWDAVGYQPQEQRTRWVKPLDGPTR
ncbi:hypothetical protein [Streptomyces sp. NPDC059979]|uniref:hypothetical protein n=1 Tax=unclassified Streptomyces TaxID=2593676 RepID=UPI003654C45B